MTLRENIAKLLMQSRIGMTRKELFEKTDSRLHNDDANRISDQLFHLKKANHAEKSGNEHGARWSITPQGRSYYSDLNDEADETDAKQTPSSLSSDPGMDSPQQDHALADVQTVEAGADAADIQDDNDEQLETQENGPLLMSIDDQMSKAHDNTEAPYTNYLAFNTTDNMLDKALFGLVKLIRDVATQQPEIIAIEDKQEAIDLMESLEHNTLFSIKHRETFAKIRVAVALMEDAE